MDKTSHFWWIDSNKKLQLSPREEVLAVFGEAAQKKFMRDTIELVKKEMEHAPKGK
jgi:hypothetical protein